MEKWALAVGFESKECGAAIKEYQNYGICVRKMGDMQEVAEELVAKNNYLLIIIFPETKWILEDIRTIRSLTGAPVLVLADKYDGAAALLGSTENPCFLYKTPADFPLFFAAHGVARVRFFCSLFLGGGIAGFRRCRSPPPGFWNL